MKIEELENKIRKFRWLQEVADKHRDMIKTIRENEETFTVGSIGYSVIIGGMQDYQHFNVCMYKNIFTRYVKEGLSASLGSIEKEMEELRVEIEKNDG